jgi:hypothetical protein
MALLHRLELETTSSATCFLSAVLHAGKMGLQLFVAPVRKAWKMASRFSTPAPMLAKSTAGLNRWWPHDFLLDDGRLVSRATA